MLVAPLFILQGEKLAIKFAALVNIAIGSKRSKIPIQSKTTSKRSECKIGYEDHTYQ